MTRTDLTVIGAGLAGLPIAIACAQAGWQVTLVDQHKSIDALPTDPLDQRCTAISSASVGLLSRWGIWPAIEANAQSIQQVHISQKGYLGSVRLQANDVGVKALGYVIENRQWAAALSTVVGNHEKIRWLRGETVDSVRDDNDGTVAVTLASGQRIDSSLLIAADGVNSRVRDLVGVGDTHYDYKQSALMTTLQLAKPHESMAFERFTAQGPLAFLPRPNNMMSVVWCLPKSDAQHWTGADDSLVVDQLQALFGFKLGRFQSIGPKVVVPLIRREAINQVGTRTVLLGNAARLLHPVAGQGFNLVLRDLTALLDLMGAKTDDAAIDPGSNSLLSEFVATRARDQKEVVFLTDTLAQGFLGEASMPAHLRGLALMGLDSIGPMRKHFAGRMMGYTG